MMIVFVSLQFRLYFFIEKKKKYDKIQGLRFYEKSSSVQLGDNEIL